MSKAYDSKTEKMQRFKRLFFFRLVFKTSPKLNQPSLPYTPASDMLTTPEFELGMN